MGMVVRTNTMAMNAQRQLGMNNNAVSKSLEKLSSGFRINRAADDASGLAISEKMKAQIKGLEQASSNSQDGISLIQTAEGATTEIHNMLNRMVELATKSANGTIQDEVDREAIQREVDDLNTEITRIAKSTNFNGINLLDGNLSGGGAASGATTTKGATVAVDALVSDAISVTEAVKGEYEVDLTTADQDGKLDITYKDASGSTKTISVDVSNGDDADAMATALKDTALADVFDITETGGTITFANKVAGKGQAEILIANNGALAAGEKVAATEATAAADAYMSIDISKLTAFENDGSVDINKSTFTVNGQKFGIANGADAKKALEAKGYTVIDNGAAGAGVAGKVADLVNAINIKLGGGTPATAGAGTSIDFKAQTDGTAASSSGGLKLQVGDTNDEFNHVTVSVDDLTAEGIGTAGLDVSTQDAAGNSIQTIKDAINQVSTNRANLGSLQNRLEYTINNLDTTAENMTSANSRIRDTDMAKEMMNYTKMNVLTQAAQAMLAQANQQPQSILQLLQ